MASSPPVLPSSVYRSQYDNPDPGPAPDALLILLPLLIVLSTFLFLLLVFLICVLLVRRRRGISLNDNSGPVDLSREELIEGEGGFDGFETRWLESVSENVRREYLRARDHQLQYRPNSFSTDITLSQFLSIQEKGVSAWSFEPEFETVNSLIVHARTEITFLPDPASSSCVQSNLPLPKLNEVYYWEVKMFDLPETTTVSVGLATKPYPPFRLPGWNRYSVAYHSNGDKSHNYPFTSTAFGPALKEGDVLGVGYRPRTGTVFFTRNGRKMEDAFIGLGRWNFFPTIGADGPCSVHVNLGQAGFVYIEANVKKWGLAPSVGTLAPPPAYGSERGSILLDVGGGRRHAEAGRENTNVRQGSRRSRHRHARPSNFPSGSTYLSAPTPLTPPPPISPISEELETSYSAGAGPSRVARIFGRGRPEGYQPISTDGDHGDDDDDDDDGDAETESISSSSTPRLGTASPPGARNPFTTRRRQLRSFTHPATLPSDSFPAGSSTELTIHVQPPPDSPMSPAQNPPTPGQRDIHMQALSSRLGRGTGSRLRPESIEDEGSSDEQLGSLVRMTRREPPAYSPVDAFRYADGVHIDLPAEVITAALEGNGIPAESIGQSNTSNRRSRRR